MLTTEQHLARARGIAASDIAAILNRNPWKGPADVFAAKVGARVDSLGDDVRVDWGNRLEEPIRAWYAHTMRVDVTVPGTLAHPTDPIALATPDGVVYPPAAPTPRNGLEIKTHTISLRHLYGEPGTDEVPIWELLQCVWNMYVTGLPFWHLVAFIDGLPAVYLIERDRELEELCRDAAHQFWHRHVLPRRLPDPDGSDSYAADLLRRFPSHTREELIAAGAAELEAIRELRNVRDQVWALERRQAVLEQRLKAAIGTAAGLTFSDGGPRTDKITWKRNRDSHKTDWKAAAYELGGQAGMLADGARAVLERAVAARAIQPDVALAIAASLNLAELPSTDDVIARHTELIAGARPFCVPRAWSRERPTD